MDYDVNERLSIVQAPTARSLALFYNMVLKERGIQLPAHLVPVVHALADTRINYLMVIVGPGCLSGDTCIGYERTPGSGLKKTTLEELYHKFNGVPWHVPTTNPWKKTKSKSWDLRVPTRTLSWTGDRLAMNEIKQVIQSGVKEVYQLTTVEGASIKASGDHPFLVRSPESNLDLQVYKTLDSLLPGDVVYVRNKIAYKGGRGKKEFRRAYTYSIPFHPHGYRNFVCNRNYKRLPTARLILEANINNLTLDEFIEILRTDEVKSNELKYISPQFDIHHINENELDDRIDNLEAISPEEHRQRHCYEKQKNFGNILLKENHVKSILYVGKELTYDIVMQDPHRNFLANDFIVHNSGKSLLLTEIFPAWSLGHDPTLTIMGVSAGEKLIQGFMRSVMEIIKWSPVWKAIFPKVRPDESAGWSTDNGMFVTGRSIGNSDASYAAFGLDSKVLTGKHAKMLLFDDLHDKDNSASEDQCAKVWDTYNNTLIGRADPGGARFIVAGRRWGKLDVYQHLMDTGEFVVLTLPAEREKTNKLWIDVSIPDNLTCCFNDS